MNLMSSSKWRQWADEAYQFCRNPSHSTESCWTQALSVNRLCRTSHSRRIMKAFPFEEKWVVYVDHGKVMWYTTQVPVQCYLLVYFGAVFTVVFTSSNTPTTPDPAPPETFWRPLTLGLVGGELKFSMTRKIASKQNTGKHPLPFN